VWDLFIGKVLGKSFLPLYIYHQLQKGSQHGRGIVTSLNSLSDRFRIKVNPNTIYPLLRRLEEQGFVAGQWEHPETRSRRFYTITPAGETEYARLKAEVEPKMRATLEILQTLIDEIFGEEVPGDD
jgi:DNA-binding PadR family transcriptional regulator